MPNPMMEALTKRTGPLPAPPEVPVKDDADEYQNIMNELTQIKGLLMGMKSGTPDKPMPVMTQSSPYPS